MKARVDCGICGGIKRLGRPCVPCVRRHQRAYKLRHVEKVKAANTDLKKRQWAAGAETRRIRQATQRATLRDRRRCAKRKWKRENPGAVNASTARRFAAKLHAIPSWANTFFISEAYSLARLRSRCTGIKHHVDHKNPLRSSLICGLHTHDNLRVIPAVENMRKGNRLELAA